MIYSGLLACFTMMHSVAAEGTDPSLNRMIVTSNYIYLLTPDSMRTNSGSEIVMRYDLKMDPYMSNKVNPWDGGFDLYLKTAYDYTRWDGPLGMYEQLIVLLLHRCTD
jgi:hypothetical protein